MNPLVTVYLTVRNRPMSAYWALCSILNQSYREIEVIVVDDNSTDAHVDHFLHLAAPIRDKFEFIHNETQLGASRSRNIAIFKAKGEFITGLDDDDYFLRTRVETFLREWKEEDIFLYSDQLAENQNLKILERKDFNIRRLHRNNFIGNQIFIETEKLRGVHGFNESLYGPEEWDLFLRIYNKYGAGRHISEPNYVIFDDPTAKRISNDPKVLKGYLNLYKIHKRSMNRSDRKAHLFNIYHKRNRVSVFGRNYCLFSMRNAYNFYRRKA